MSLVDTNPNRSTAVSYVEEKTEGLQVAIAYVYCDYQDPSTSSEVEIFSSITRQLAEQCEVIPVEVKAFRDRYTGKRSLPSPEERVSLVRALAQHFERTYVFIDALVTTSCLFRHHILVSD